MSQHIDQIYIDRCNADISQLVTFIKRVEGDPAWLRISIFDTFDRVLHPYTQSQNGSDMPAAFNINHFIGEEKQFPIATDYFNDSVVLSALRNTAWRVAPHAIPHCHHVAGKQGAHTLEMCGVIGTAQGLRATWVRPEPEQFAALSPSKQGQRIATMHRYMDKYRINVRSKTGSTPTGRASNDGKRAVKGSPPLHQWDIDTGYPERRTVHPLSGV